MKRILVPIDFSRPAQHAYRLALDIARKTKAHIFLLRVIDIPFMYESYSTTVPTYLNPELWGKLEKESEESFRKMDDGRSRHGEVTVRTIEGPVTSTILDFIDKEKIDLVVMGTNGVTGIDEFIIGSKTEKVVRTAKVPVLAVHNPVELASIENIVVPTILERYEPGFTEALKELQALSGATLHFVMINTPHNHLRNKGERAEMEKYVQQYEMENYTLNIRDDFSEEAGILTFAKEIHGDIIAMATHGRRGLSHLFNGSITEDLVNHAVTPIWAYSIRK